MPLFSINIPANQVTKIENAFAKAYGYQEEVNDPAFPTDIDKKVSNPKTKAMFFREMIINHIKGVVANYEKEEAIRAISVDIIDLS